MHSVSGVALTVMMLASGIAWGAGARGAGARDTVDPWDSVEGLIQGTEIDVFSGNQAGPDVCVLSAVDENALTCLVDDAGRDTRMVFPRSAVRSIWVYEQGRERHLAAWIGVGIGFVLGGALCAEGGPGAFFACGALGAGLMGGMVTQQARPGPFGYPGPMRPARWRRRMVYRAPLSAVSP